MMARVLMADDNVKLTDAVTKLLAHAGHDVTAVPNGAEALLALRKNPHYDVLILDMIMPVMDGFGVLRAVGPTAPPIIIATGTEITAEDLKIAGGKVVHVLSKRDFQPQELIEAVNDALIRHPNMEPDE